jgi:hypothetical protein
LEKADALRPRGAIGEGSPRCAARAPDPIFASANFIFYWGIKNSPEDIGKRILRSLGANGKNLRIASPIKSFHAL